MKTNSYQAAPLDVDEDQTLLQVERGMPVRLIATFEGLTTTTPDEPAISASNNANAHRFDYLPVRQSQLSAHLTTRTPTDLITYRFVSQRMDLL